MYIVYKYLATCIIIYTAVAGRYTYIMRRTGLARRII